MLKKDRDVLCHISGPRFCSEQFRRAAILNRFTIEDFHKYMDPWGSLPVVQLSFFYLCNFLKSSLQTVHFF